MSKSEAQAQFWAGVVFMGIGGTVLFGWMALAYLVLAIGVLMCVLSLWALAKKP